MNAPTLYTKFAGWWCDECRIAAQWHNCPSCGLRMRPAVVEVSPTDEAPQDGHVYECCGKVGRISRHESWCPVMLER